MRIQVNQQHILQIQKVVYLLESSHKIPIMNIQPHSQQFSTIVQTIGQLDLSELDQLMDTIVRIRKQKLPNVLNDSESALLRKINITIPFEIQARYDIIRAKLQKEELLECEHEELLELTAYIEHHDANRLGYLIELAHLRNVLLPQLLKDLEINPAPHVV